METVFQKLQIWRINTKRTLEVVARIDSTATRTTISHCLAKRLKGANLCKIQFEGRTVPTKLVALQLYNCAEQPVVVAVDQRLDGALAEIVLGRDYLETACRDAHFRVHL
jgi:hypothetical protein